MHKLSVLKWHFEEEWYATRLRNLIKAQGLEKRVLSTTSRRQASCGQGYQRHIIIKVVTAKDLSIESAIVNVSDYQNQFHARGEDKQETGLKKRSSEGAMRSVRMVLRMHSHLTLTLSLLLLLPHEQGRVLAVPLEEKRYVFEILNTFSDLFRFPTPFSKGKELVILNLHHKI
jgi:hypothetical protein